MLEEKLLIFERLIELRTIKNNIDKNFLHQKDLEDLQYIASQLKIEIAKFDFEKETYELEDLFDIYNIWSSQINLMCKQQRAQILEGD